MSRANRSIRSRRGRKKLNKVFDLQLTSMLDILVIILVFLLKSYSVSMNDFNTLPGMKLPTSMSPDNPPDSLHLIITAESMTFENERILDFIKSGEAIGTEDAKYEFKNTDIDEGGRRVVPLYNALIKAREKAELLRAKSTARDASGKPLPFDGVLAIQADKRINYDVLRKVMYTAATAEFKIFRLLAMKKEM